MKIVDSFSNIPLTLIFLQLFIGLQERTLHDALSESDIKVNFEDLLMKFSFNNKILKVSLPLHM
jgi:hypothetical protein